MFVIQVISVKLVNKNDFGVIIKNYLVPVKPMEFVLLRVNVSVMRVSLDNPVNIQMMILIYFNL